MQGLCPSALKNVCRKLGISRWPYRSKNAAEAASKPRSGSGAPTIEAEKKPRSASCAPTASVLVEDTAPARVHRTRSCSSKAQGRALPAQPSSLEAGPSPTGSSQNQASKGTTARGALEEAKATHHAEQQEEKQQQQGKDARDRAAAARGKEASGKAQGREGRDAYSEALCALLAATGHRCVCTICNFCLSIYIYI